MSLVCCLQCLKLVATSLTSGIWAHRETLFQATTLVSTTVALDIDAISRQTFSATMQRMHSCLRPSLHLFH